MCVPAAAALLGTLGAGSAAAAGATAAATTVGSTIATLGTILSVGGSIYQGVQGAKAAKANARAVEAQAATEAQVNATEDQRRRQKFSGQIAQQRAELAARGVGLDSVTAVMLGQTAAQEMSFESQSVRSGGEARQIELSNSARASRAQAASSLLKGGLSAAGGLLTAAPDLWPGFMDKRIGGRALS